MIPDWIYIATGAAAEAAVLVWDIATDYRDIQKGKPINHSNQGFKRLMMLSIPIVLFTLGIVWTGGTLLANIGIIALCVFVSTGGVFFRFWLFFDGLLSNKRRRDFFDLGSDDPGDADTDNFLQGLKRWQHIALKVGGAVVFTGGYVAMVLLK